MHWQQTPDTFIPGLRSLPWWDNADVPLTKVLEKNQAKLRKDAEKLLKRRRGGWDETYSSLIADGDWQKLSLCTLPEAAQHSNVPSCLLMAALGPASP